MSCASSGRNRLIENKPDKMSGLSKQEPEGPINQPFAFSSNPRNHVAAKEETTEMTRVATAK